MTGFGSHTLQCEDVNFTVDIKSINSKQFDFILKLPPELKEMEKENEIRQLAMNALSRGKVECVISIEKKNGNGSANLNRELIVNYYNELKSIADTLGEKGNLMEIVMKMPEVIESTPFEMDDLRWGQLLQTVQEACNKLNKSREQEGDALSKDFALRIRLILKYLDAIEPMEAERIAQIRGRLNKSLNDNREQWQHFDENRLEQEIIFYLEKLDFTEEKVRIRKHCAYFMETTEETLNGKKLSFITQEIGREINTLGSKACHAEIQQLVVQMKDELEKIKEQLANIL